MIVAQNRTNRRRDRGGVGLLIVCGLVLSGCAGAKSLAEDIAARATLAPAAPETLRLRPLAPTTSNVFTRSYRVGESYTSRVGEPMLSVKNYALNERVARATALRDFEQLCGRLFSEEPGRCKQSPLSNVHGGLASVFDVQGAVSTSDGDYFAVSLPVTDSKEVIYLLVDPNGRLRLGGYVAWRRTDSKGYSAAGVPLVEEIPKSPLDSETPLFTFENQQSVAASGPGYLNYDLIYMGSHATARGDNIFLSYREYARQTADHLMFEQTLQYPGSQHDIDVAGLRLHVESADPESVTFRVVEDSQRGAGHE
ncbi:MAG: hypothetical protein HY899_06200 [Deltaproteobacteria bacterium]|nr:hypothetical protein [Deltaproteobacteria bacterium]